MSRIAKPSHVVARVLCKLWGLSGNYPAIWISREPVALPWCNVAVRGETLLCIRNCYSPVGLVSRQRDAVHWACVLCDRHIHNDRANRSASTRQCAFPFYSSRAGFFFFDKASHQPGLSAPLQYRFDSLRRLAFPSAQIAVERVEICECDVHTAHKLSTSHCRLTSPTGENCSRIHSKASWLAAMLHQGHATGRRDIQNGWILSGLPLYLLP